DRDGTQPGQRQLRQRAAGRERPRRDFGRLRPFPEAVGRRVARLRSNPVRTRRRPPDPRTQRPYPGTGLDREDRGADHRHRRDRNRGGNSCREPGGNPGQSSASHRRALRDGARRLPRRGRTGRVSHLGRRRHRDRGHRPRARRRGAARSALGLRPDRARSQPRRGDAAPRSVSAALEAARPVPRRPPVERRLLANAGRSAGARVGEPHHLACPPFPDQQPAGTGDANGRRPVGRRWPHPSRRTFAPNQGRADLAFGRGPADRHSIAAVV
ncbi:MAG: Metal-dependent hydrolases of the beta-lactamase superfamily I, partial [uncultured Thermomicrobiales bacterium]